MSTENKMIAAVKEYLEERIEELIINEEMDEMEASEYAVDEVRNTVRYLLEDYQ